MTLIEVSSSFLTSAGGALLYMFIQAPKLNISV